MTIATLMLSFSLASAVHFALQTPRGPNPIGILPKSSPRLTVQTKGYLGTSLFIVLGSLIGGSLLLNVALQYNAVREKQQHVQTRNILANGANTSFILGGLVLGTVNLWNDR